MSPRRKGPIETGEIPVLGGTECNNLDIGSAIARARQAAHVSQAELAARTGIQQPTLSRLEHGLASPTVNSLERIAAGLGLTLSISFETPEQ